MKSIILGIFIGMALSAVLVMSGRAFADDAGTPDSGKSSENIGAWYDESWVASGFYRLNEQSSHNYIYEYTANPVSGSVGTFKEDPREGTPTGGGHTYTASGASIPQDTVVTEWNVTGHVHFKSGI